MMVVAWPILMRILVQFNGVSDDSEKGRSWWKVPTTYTVGDSSGWDISTNLDAWIADKNFRVGDALGQSVEEVTKENFNTCNTTNVLATHGNGNTTVPLTRAGDRYFVSGNKLYCLGGMKLHAHVQGDDKSLAPTLAPKAVAGSDQNTATLPQSPSSKKNTHLSAGAANPARDALHLVYIAPMAAIYGMMKI
ncbi:hypothetical protein JHK82_028639 [Glycine max]|nr:hypothetical protein JHK85_029307 [Glycine max]KAG5127804.1 hypothetical protein JHK82_028639 [Glycine max]